MSPLPPQQEEEIDHPKQQESQFSTVQKSSSTPVLLKDGVWSILWNAMNKLMSEAPTVLSTSRSKNNSNNDYEAEKLFLTEAYRPIMYGFGSTCILFITFRVASSQWWQNFLLKQKKNGKQMHHREQQQQQQWKSDAQRQLEERSQLLNDAVTIPLDLLLSIVLGLSISAITARPSKLKVDLQQAPLTIHGKSLLVKTLCPPMMELYQKHNTPITPIKNDEHDVDFYHMDHHTTNDHDKQQQTQHQDDYMIWLQIFTQNCKARFDLEQQIRLEHNLLPEDNDDGNHLDVAIPPDRLRTLIVQQEQTKTKTIETA